MPSPSESALQPSVPMVFSSVSDSRSLSLSPCSSLLRTPSLSQSPSGPAGSNAGVAVGVGVASGVVPPAVGVGEADGSALGGFGVIVGDSLFDVYTLPNTLDRTRRWNRAVWP